MRAPLLWLPLIALALGGCTCQSVRPHVQDPCADGTNPCTEPNRSLCVDEGGVPRCLCNAGFVPRPSGACEPVGAANCPEHPGDGAEPDDCLSRARPLRTTDAPRTQTIEPVGDYDFFRFDATAGHVYVVTVKPQGSLMPRLDLFDQGGVWLSADERTDQAQLAVKARATAPHFFRVSQSPIDPSVATGGYTVSLATSGQEDHGDGPDQATAITAETSLDTAPKVVGRFEYPGDQDWFSFPASGTQIYRITFDTNGDPPPVAIYGGGNTTSPTWTAHQSIVEFELPDGTGFLQLYLPPGELGGYGFQFTRRPK